MWTLNIALEKFPASYKQIISSKSNKKDMVTVLIEDVIRRANGHPTITALSIKFMASMYMARDKSKMHYGLFIQRVISNLRMYLNVLKPRVFSDQNTSKEINEPLPIDSECFSFIFHADSQENLSKLTIKDMRSQITHMFKVRQNITLLFSILNLAIEGGNHDIVVSTSYN